MPTKPFRGRIAVDVRDSVPDWGPFLPPQAKEGAPNVLYVVWDDTGIGAWDIYGGLIRMPNLQRIAKTGVRFTNWHTTALCSPTRSCLLTGRNATRNNMACITEGANGFPGLSGVVPPENGMLSEILLENGYSTFCVGKWHLTPTTEESMGGSRRTWPLSRGFDRFYGFLGGETNQWYPSLVQDQGHVEQPYMPDEGYHLSKDLGERAKRFIADVQESAPGKPWFCYLSFGANHAPHQAPKEWIDQYRGVFDMGYEKYREIVLENMKKLGIMPENVELSPINPWGTDVIIEGDLVRPWDSLNDGEKRLFARMAEAYAGMSSYTDHQLGLLLDHLESSGALENTIVVVVSDNGASGEGGPNGSVNENRFFNGYPDSLEDNLAMLEELGGENTYNHYPTGWAWAFNTPFKLFKRYSLEGGIADPFVIAYPKRWKPKKLGGHIRHQYHHAVDVVPTILELCGIEPPARIKGAAQSEFDGVSMVPSIEDASAASGRITQIYTMLGTRALYHDGWKVVARHGALTGTGHFMEDPWELYHVAEDRAESVDLSAQHPDKLRELVAMWYAEAGRNQALPIDDRTPLEQLGLERPTTVPPQDRYVYYPGVSEIPESISANIRGRSFALGASLREVVPGDAEGVIFAQGSRFGGQTLFVQNGKVIYVYNFLGIEEQRLEWSAPLPKGRVSIGVVFTKKGLTPEKVPHGDVEMYVNKKSVAKGTMRTQLGHFSLSGDGLAVGRDTGDAVSRSYRAPFVFRGGVFEFVAIDVSGAPTRDLEREFAALLARD